MRNLSALLIGTALLLGAGVSRAIQAPAAGLTGLKILNLPLVEIPATSALITLNGAGGFGPLTKLDIPTGKFQVEGGLLDVTDPGSAPLKGVVVTLANQLGAFGGVGGAGFTGIMPVQGIAKVCLFNPCTAAVANLSVPLGVVGTSAGTNFGTAAINLTVRGAPWTTGTATVGSSTAMGGLGPASKTASPGGHIQLVSPIFVSTNIGASAIVPVFAIMDLTIPEPGELALMSATIAGLAVCGFAKRRRPRRSAPLA